MSPERSTPRRSVTRTVRSHLAPITLASSSLLLVVWTWLTLGTGLLHGLDAASLTPRLAANSNAAQTWAGIAVVTQPVVLAVALLLVSTWAWRRRLRNLAWALLGSVVFSWGGYSILKHLFRRTRPPSALDGLVTYHGWAYPSGHMAMATTAAVMVIATTTTTRQPWDVRYLWRFLGVAGVALVAWDRFVLNAHWPTDIVGGALVGVLAASLACVLAKVHMVPVPAAVGPGDGRRTCAVIWNPAKVMDSSSFHRSIEWELDSHGWAGPLWLQTRVDDPGREMARQAVAAGVDLVLVAGGDGTVRVVCSELANTGIPLGIIPAGTGNLLARNLGIPLDEVAAARVAIGGHPKPVDLVKVTVDDDPATTDHFAVMAGMGFDAAIMEATRPELKRTVGSAAYFVAAAGQVRTPPMDITFQIDDRPEQQRHATVVVVGNVGFLQGGIQLFPKASATDGLLDVIVASPRGVRDWANMTARLLARLRDDVTHVDELRGSRLRVTCPAGMPYELDGDTGGRATVFEAEVVPQALRVMQR